MEYPSDNMNFQDLVAEMFQDEGSELQGKDEQKDIEDKNDEGRNDKEEKVPIETKKDSS